MDTIHNHYSFLTSFYETITFSIQRNENNNSDNRRFTMGEKQVPRERPNILFLFTDDQRFNTIHALGNEEIHTPTMDYLVKTGTGFTRSYIMGGTCPAVCMPSRAMLLTGKTLFHLHNSGETIPEDHSLMPEVFRENGYTTFGTGKWHNSPSSYARSFSTGGQIFFGGMDDHWNVPACAFDPTGHYPEARLHPWDPGYGDVQYIPKQFDHIERGKHSTELFADEARKFLLNYKDDQPFFMYVPFMAPHDPRTMPQQFLNLYDPDTIELPPNFAPRHPFDNGELSVRDELLADFPRSEKEIRRHLAEYYAMISHLDFEIGRILDALRATGQFENTIIVLSGDNGLALGSHGLMGKQNNYDHSVHVPLVMTGPGITADSTRDELCYLLDIFPTLCDLSDIEAPESVDGLSFASVLTNRQEDPSRENRPRKSVPRNSLAFAYKDVQRSVMDEQYKLIEYCVDGNRRTQLFDLVDDPYELKDLSADGGYTDTLKRMRSLLLEWREELDDPYDDFWKGFQA